MCLVFFWTYPDTVRFLNHEGDNLRQMIPEGPGVIIGGVVGAGGLRPIGHIDGAATPDELTDAIFALRCRIAEIHLPVVVTGNLHGIVHGGRQQQNTDSRVYFEARQRQPI